MQILIIGAILYFLLNNQTSGTPSQNDLVGYIPSSGKEVYQDRTNKIYYYVSNGKKVSIAKTDFQQIVVLPF